MVGVRWREIIECVGRGVEGWVEDGLPGARGHMRWRDGAVRVAYDNMSGGEVSAHLTIILSSLVNPATQ